MAPRRCALATSMLLSLAGCQKTAASHAGDAGDASADARELFEAAAPATPLEDAGALASPAPTAVELSALQPPPSPFSGTFRCFGGLKLEQSGRFVTSTLHKGTTDTVLACTAGIDTCIGTVREIQTPSGRPPKVMHVKPVTLQRTPGGDILYMVGSSSANATKADQTLCQRR